MNKYEYSFHVKLMPYKSQLFIIVIMNLIFLKNNLHCIKDVYKLKT